MEVEDCVVLDRPHVNIPRWSVRGRPCAALAVGVLVVGVLVVGALVSSSASPVSAVADGGSSAGVEDPSVFGAPVPGAYTPPLDAAVLDGFRMDHGPYGPGNRGLEYASPVGAVVRTIGTGVVVFAGPVVGRLAITVLHPDGRRSSLTGLSGVSVAVGDLVVRGQTIATAGAHLHLGVREGERYIDPSLLFGPERRRAVLVPLGVHVGD